MKNQIKNEWKRVALQLMAAGDVRRYLHVLMQGAALQAAKLRNR